MQLPRSGETLDAELGAIRNEANEQRVEMKSLRLLVKEQQTEMKALRELLRSIITSHFAFRELHSDLCSHHAALCSCLQSKGLVSEAELLRQFRAICFDRAFGDLLLESSVTRRLLPFLGIVALRELSATSRPIAARVARPESSLSLTPPRQSPPRATAEGGRVGEAAGDDRPPHRVAPRHGSRSVDSGTKPMIQEGTSPEPRQRSRQRSRQMSSQRRGSSTKMRQTNKPSPDGAALVSCTLGVRPPARTGGCKFRLQQIVQLCNLQSRTDLNGRKAKLVAYDPSSSRWCVEVLDSLHRVRVGNGNLRADVDSFEESRQSKLTECVGYLRQMVQISLLLSCLTRFVGSRRVVALVSCCRMLRASVWQQGRIFLCGGCDGESAISLVECFHTATGTWQRMPSMPMAHDGAAMTAVGGRLYILGGYDRDGALEHVESMDLATGCWQHERPMKVRRVFATVAVLGGRIYVCGGSSDPDSECALRSVDIFSLADQRWSGGPEMRHARASAASASFEGRLYICGGADVRALVSAECLDVAGSGPPQILWRLLPSMQEERHFAGQLVLRGCIYLCGGRGIGDVPLRSVEAFHMHRKEWESLPPMSFGRVGVSALATGPQSLMVCGGCEAPQDLFSAESYDIAVGAWQTLRPMRVARSFASAVLHAGYVYVCGGTSPSHGMVIRSSERYNLATGDWEQLPDMGVARIGSNCHSIFDAAVPALEGS